MIVKEDSRALKCAIYYATTLSQRYGGIAAQQTLLTFVYSKMTVHGGGLFTMGTIYTFIETVAGSDNYHMALKFEQCNNAYFISA